MKVHEPKCVVWKRLGSEKIRLRLEGLTLSQELEFWRKQTEKLKAAQRKISGKTPEKNIKSASALPCYTDSGETSAALAP